MYQTPPGIPGTLFLPEPATSSGDVIEQFPNNHNNYANGADFLSYPDGTSVIDPNTNQPYIVPPGFDIIANIKFALDFLNADDSLLARTHIMINLFSEGSIFDYQRPNGFISAIINHDFNDDYTDISNYNYGVISAILPS